MRLDCGCGVRLSLVDCRIPQVIPSHRLARHARTLQHANLQQQLPLHHSSSSSASLQQEQRSIEESITAHRRQAVGDLDTGTASPSPLPPTAREEAALMSPPIASSSSPASFFHPVSPSSSSSTSPTTPTRLLRVAIPEAEAESVLMLLDDTSSSSSSSSLDPTRSSSSSPSPAFLGGQAAAPPPTRKSRRSPSPFSTSTAFPSSHSLAHATAAPTSSSSPVPDSSSLARPSARLQRIYRRMKGAAHAEADDAAEEDGQAERDGQLLLQPTAELPIFTVSNATSHSATLPPRPLASAVPALPVYAADKGGYPQRLSAFSPVLPQSQPSPALFSLVRPPTPTLQAPIPCFFFPPHRSQHHFSLPLPPPHHEPSALPTMPQRGFPLFHVSPSPSSSSPFIAVPAHLISTLSSQGVTMSFPPRPFPMIV